MRVGELPEHPRLADAGLTDDCDELPAPAPSEIERGRELGHLDRPSDERGEPPRGVCMEARAYRTRAQELVHLDRLAQAFHLSWPE